MGIAAYALEHRPGDRLEQGFVGQRQPPEPRLVAGGRPIILRPERRIPALGHVEGAPAPDPALDQVRMDLARLLDREIALAHRSVTSGPESHLLLDRGRGEELEYVGLHL